MFAETPLVQSLETEFRKDVFHGLSKSEKSIPSKYFYDEAGSALFEEICGLDEYYLTRAELQIMKLHSRAIAGQLAAGARLVEFGSGSSLKTRFLLDALVKPAAYVPVDVSREHLFRTAAELQKKYTELKVLPVVADFTSTFELPDCDPAPSSTAIYFPGSTLGNLTLPESRQLLRGMADMAGPDGGLVIGVDLQKDIQRIEAAYNDSRGVTEAFNLNLLTRINRELKADFDLASFRHEARYDSNHHRIETHIVSLRDQTVSIGDQQFQFAEGEKMLTEYSYKYSIPSFSVLAAESGWVLKNTWTDSNRDFAVLHLVHGHTTGSSA
ncbi:MAG: L-histidine N(alpha)-methyltransferase [Planctomycetota bacterium]|nr:L-histidine N(alpha)-methyltransferase [Planctomycetota bacterium]